MNHLFRVIVISHHGQYFPPFLRWCTPWQSHRPLVRNPLEASWSGTRSDYHQLIWDKEKLSPLDLGQGVIIIFRGKLDSTMAAKTVGQNNLEQLSFTHNSNQMRSSSLLVENSAEPQWRDSRSKPQQQLPRESRWPERSTNGGSSWTHRDPIWSLTFLLAEGSGPIWGRR